MTDSRTGSVGCPGLSSRALAADLLGRVLDDWVPLDTALEEAARTTAWQRLGPADRAFARLIVATVLRRLGQIDDALARFLSRPLPAKTARSRHILRLGAAQILFLGVAPHAVVATAVDLAASDSRTAGWKNLVNAVLRNLARQGATILEGRDAARQNTPDWLWCRWSETYGEERARAIAASHLVEPPLDLTVKAEPERWAAALGGIVLATGTVRLIPKGPIEALPGFGEGEWWVQDAAASLPVRLFGSVAGRRVLDLCAAPGGKTAQLAAAGASVTAVDISAKRLERVAQNLARLRLQAEIVEADALTWNAPEPFDAVLLDAPCSATGTIRRHPDVPHIKRQADLRSLTELQSRLLERALSLAKPGAIVVYSTCSLEPEEGERIIETALARGAPAERLPVAPGEIGGLSGAIAPLGELRTLPSMLAGPEPRLSGMDGFFAARLRRL